MADHTKIELPDSLKAQLLRFEQRLRSVESVMVVLGVVAAALLTYTLSFLSDRLWDTPRIVRTSLILASHCLLLGSVAWWLMHWWWRRRNTRTLARLIQKVHRKLGDRLLGVVELAEGTDDDRYSSESLRRAAISQVAREAQDMDFDEAVSTRKAQLYGKTAVFLTIIVIVFFVLAPAAGVNAFARWLSPLSSIDRYTFTRIDGFPDSLITAHGETFEISGTFSPDSRWRPDTGILRVKGSPDIEAAIEEDSATFVVPGLTEDSRLQLLIGDIRKPVEVSPMYRPELRRLSAMIKLPSYLQRKPEKVQVSHRTMRLLEGSEVRFTGVLDRDAASATLQAESNTVPLTVQAQRFSSPALNPEDLGRCRFEWTDIYGLAEAEPHSVKISAVKDSVPAVECSGVARAVAILQEEVVTMHVRAEDDYGLQSLWADWAVDPRTAGDAEPLKGTTSLSNGSPVAMQLDAEFEFSPILFSVPEGALVNIHGRAKDYCPDNAAGESSLYRVYVLSRAQHAKIIENQMHALRARLEDIIREEEHLLENNKALTGKTPEELAKAENTSQLKKNTRNEKDNRENVKKLSGECSKLMQEAMRNNDISERVLRRWAEMISTLNKTAAGDMQKSEKALKSAAMSKSKRGEKVNKAAGLEKDIIKALRGSEKEMSSSLEDMMAESFINRLRTAATKEGDISAVLKTSLAETVGLSAADMPRTWRTKFGEMAVDQSGVAGSVKNIRDDLAGFYNRTRLDEYNDIRRDMERKEAVKKLGAIAGTIRKNAAGIAMGDVDLWKKQLNDWADQLQGASDGSKGGKGGEPTSLDAADMELLIALIRARRKEEMLRAQTRLVEKKKEGMKDYRKSARHLSRDQYDLANTTRPLERAARHQKLKQLIQKVGGEMMNAGMMLRKPKTDAETIAIQTEIIELLSGCISNCKNQMAGGPSSAAAMMLAMGMQPGMGSGAGMAGGGSTMGGTTDAVNDPNEGDAGSDYDERGIETTGGIDMGELPAEFRDVMQAYFNAIEDDS